MGDRFAEQQALAGRGELVFSLRPKHLRDAQANGPKNGVPYRAKFWMDNGVLYVEGVCGDDVAMHQGEI